MPLLQFALAELWSARDQDTNSIRKAILRYQLEHPVVNDADHRIWDAYDVDAWPTLVRRGRNAWGA